MEKVNQVFKTYDYSKFKLMEGNREINIKHLNIVKNSLYQKQLPLPIIVTPDKESDKLLVFEGQHRITALKQLEKPVYFMIIDNLDITDAVTINSIQRKWTSMDYFKQYLAQGRESYKQVQYFMELTGLSMHISRMFLEGIGTQSKNTYKNFINGNMIIKDFNMSLEIYYKHLDFEKCPAFDKAIFKAALVRVISNPAYDHNRMKNKLETMSYQVTTRQNISDYLHLLTEIYNTNQRKETKVYFNLDF